MNKDPVCLSACVARLNKPVPLSSLPPTIALTAPFGDIIMIAACAFECWLTWFLNTFLTAFSAAFCMFGSKVVVITTSSVVSYVRYLGRLAITQSAKYPPALDWATLDKFAGFFRANFASLVLKNFWLSIRPIIKLALSCARFKLLVGA